MAIAQWQINFIKASEAFELSLFFIFFLFLWKKLIFVKQSNYVNWWFSIFYKRQKIVSSHHFNISFGAPPPPCILFAIAHWTNKVMGHMLIWQLFEPDPMKKNWLTLANTKPSRGTSRTCEKKMGWELSN